MQLRRPNKPKYQLDNLLQKKAREGVKIHIIIYQEVSSRTTPVDSNYAKTRLTNLHPNIMVQRSPSHFQTGTFYWSHHEKLCVIDETIAFMGGFDLCFGRWDTPQHSLVDDPEEPTDEPEQQATPLAADDVPLSEAAPSADAPQPPSSSESDQDEEEAPDLYLPELVLPTMFLPIPNVRDLLPSVDLASWYSSARMYITTDRQTH